MSEWRENQAGWKIGGLNLPTSTILALSKAGDQLGIGNLVNQTWAHRTQGLPRVGDHYTDPRERAVPTLPPRQQPRLGARRVRGEYDAVPTWATRAPAQPGTRCLPAWRTYCAEGAGGRPGKRGGRQPPH